MTQRTTESDRHRVAHCWDRMTESKKEQPVRGWLDLYPVAAERLNAPVTGSAAHDWLIGLAERLRIPASSRWCSVGCGAAAQELLLVGKGRVGHLDAIDISPTALEEARRSAKAMGVENMSFKEVDFHEFDPPRESYDVVLMNMSLHHVKELDRLLHRVAGALTADGFLILNEYVGPRQFQFGDLRLTIVRELLEALPESLRRDLITGEVKRAYNRRSVAFWNEVDPSESIRSDIIVPTLERYFSVVERIDYGGTVLHLLLEHIVHNFDTSNELHMAILRLLGKFEDLLIDQGALASDFAVMVLKKLEAAPYVAEEVVSAAGEYLSPTHPEIAHWQHATAVARAHAERMASYVAEIESSLGWRMVQAVRGLFGRRW